MALFKILSNMTNPSKSMPNEYHQGYCYFDKNTGRFWIDTTDTKEGRLQINSSFFGECKKLLDSTTGQYTISQANSQVKKVDCNGFVLTPGASIFIKFTETNTYLVSDLSLNVNNTGARVIKYRNADTTRAWMKEGYTYCFVYDGDCYQLVGDLDTTYSGMSIEEGKTGTNTTNRVISAATLKAIIDARGYTTNTGTVTQVSTGVGLTGGPITNSGTIKVKLRSDTALTRDSVAATETANRVYPVVQDKSGYLAVNVPWTDNDHNTTYTLTQDASDGHKLTFTPSGGTAVTITIPDNNTTYTTAKYNYLGLMKPAYSSTGAASLTTAAASNSDAPTISARTTTAQRYYAIEVDKNGIPFVNVPWTDNNTWRGIQNNLTSSSTTDSLSAVMGKKLNDEKVTKAGDTMSGNLTVQKSTADDTGFLINNTNKTQNLGFIVGGSSGNAGLYSYTKNKWITYIDSAGNVQLNGNANTANKASAANITTTQNAIAKYSNTTGTFANSGVLIDNNNNLGVPGNITATGELNLTGNAYLHNETQADSLTAGSLLVTGNANFTQIPTAPTAAAGTSNAQLATTEFVTGAVQTVVGPMRFMGSLGGSGATITSLPTASSSNKGYTYKVIKDGTYGTITAKAGDTVISTGSDWVLIPSGDEPSGTVTSITLKAGDGIILDTDNTAITTSGTRTISHKDTSSVTNLTANGRTYVTGLTFDTYGHVTGYTTGTETVTNTDTKVTSVGNHYTPTADSSAELTASLSGTAGSYALNTEYTVLTGVKAQRDAKGHITGLTYTAQKIKDTNTTYTLAGLMGSTAIGSSTKPVYWTGSNFAGISSYEGNAATATKLSNTPNNTTTFLRGDNAWSNQLNGPLTLYREGTTASNSPAGITFTVKDTDKNLTSTAYLHVYNDHSTSYNTNLVLNSTGNTFIGAGESASSIYSAKGASQTGENLYLSADQVVFMYAHSDTATNRVGFAIDTGGNIVPQKAEAANDNVQNLGSSNNRWKNVYAATFTGALSGNASTATKFVSAQSVTLTGDTTGTASSQAGWSIATTTNQLSYKPQITTLADLDAFGKSGVNMKIAKVSALDGHTGTLTKNDGMILALPWSGGYGHQFYIDDNGYGLHHRYWYTHKVNDVDTVNFNNWVQIIDSSNYTNYTVTKTGTGASGTWGINITGSSASCTGNAATATSATKDSSGAVIKDTYVKKAGDTMTGNLGIKIGDTDKHIIFDYDGDGTAGASWRICALGSGSADTNYFTIQSGTSTVSATDWNNVIRLGQNTFDAGFGGNVYPLVNNTKTLGTSSLKWANVYATTFTGALSGNASTATKFASAQSVALTGDVTGSASSQAGWSIATTLANSGVTANTYGNTSQQTPSHGGTFNIPYFKVDAKGRITQAGTTTVKLPADSNTDTKNTAGSTDTSSKIYLIGATSQTTSSQTYSDNQVYATNGQLDANKVRIAEAVSLVYDTTLQALNFVFA